MTTALDTSRNFAEPVGKCTGKSDTPTILALDASLSCTGWARASAGSEPEFGTITTKKVGVPRLIEIRERVLILAEDAEFRNVDLVLIEGYAYGAKGAAVVSIGELGGVLRVALHEAGHTVLEIAPTSLKKWATGSGNASKDEVLAAGVRKLGYDGHSKDEIDALWLLDFARGHYDGRAMTAKQREAGEKVRWPEMNAKGVNA